MKLKFSLLLLSAATFTVACTDSDMFKNVHVKPRTTLPVGNINASDSALFGLAGIEDKMYKGEDDVLTYTDSTALRLSGAGVGLDLVTIPDQSIAVNRTVVTGGSTSISIDADFPFNIPGGEQIDSLIFRSGTFIVAVDNITSSLDPTFDISDLQLILPSLTKDGDPVVLAFNQILTLTPDHIFELQAGNRFAIQIRGTEVPSDLTFSLKRIDIQFGNLEYVAGFFGRKVISHISRTIDADALNDFTKNADYIRFEHPQMIFELDNKYNAPMLLQISSLAVDGTPVPLKAGSEGRMFYINPQGHTRMALSNGNTESGTGLSDVLTKDFSQLNLEMTTILNPTAADMQDAEYVAPDHNSMYVRDTLGGAFAMVLPLHGVMENVGFDQQIEVDLKDLNKEDFTYEKMALSLSGTNDLPLNFEITIYLTEPESMVKTPLFDNAVSFPSAQNNQKPGTAGFQSGTVNGSNLILKTLSPAMIDRLLNSDKMYLQLKASTLHAAQRESIKIYTPAELKLRIVVGAELDYVLNGD